MPPEPRRRHAGRTVLGALAAGLGAAVVFFPSLFGLGTVTGLVHLVSFRTVLSTAGLAVLGTLGVIGWASWKRFPRSARMLLAACAGALVPVLVSTGVVVQRGWGDGAGDTGAVPGGPAGAAAEAVTVLSANVFYTTRDFTPVLDAAEAGRAAVVSLQEVDRQALQEDLAGHPAGRRLEVFFAGDGLGTDSALLIEKSLAPQALEETALPYAAVGAKTTLGTFYSVHTAAPIARRPLQRTWRETVEANAALCTPGSATIVAGDFNATLDHRPLRAGTACADAADRLGVGAWGTWPSALPAWAGAQIDHQLYDQDTFTPVRAELVDLPGSDHRGLAVTFHPREQVPTTSGRH